MNSDSRGAMHLSLADDLEVMGADAVVRERPSHDESESFAYDLLRNYLGIGTPGRLLRDDELLHILDDHPVSVAQAHANVLHLENADRPHSLTHSYYYLLGHFLSAVYRKERIVRYDIPIPAHGLGFYLAADQVLLLEPDSGAGNPFAPGGKGVVVNRSSSTTCNAIPGVMLNRSPREYLFIQDSAFSLYDGGLFINDAPLTPLLSSPVSQPHLGGIAGWYIDLVNPLRPVHQSISLPDGGVFLETQTGEDLRPVGRVRMWNGGVGQRRSLSHRTITALRDYCVTLRDTAERDPEAIFTTYGPTPSTGIKDGIAAILRAEGLDV